MKKSGHSQQIQTLTENGGINMAPLMKVNPDNSPVCDDLRCVFHLD